MKTVKRRLFLSFFVFLSGCAASTGNVSQRPLDLSPEQLARMNKRDQRLNKYMPQQVFTKKERGVYAQDDRRDVYQVTEPGLKKIAAAAVLVTGRDRLVKTSDGYALKTTPYEINNVPPCADQKFRYQRRGGFCSGFLAAPDVVITAGHCVHGEDVSQLAFVFGYHMISARELTVVFSQEQVFFGKQIIKSALGPGPDGPLDFGIVKLDRNVSVATAAPAAMVSGWKPKSKALVGLAGYPVGLPLKVAFTESDPRPDLGLVTSRIWNRSATMLYARLDAFKGNSGSPVFNDRFEVIGILVSGAADFWHDQTSGCFKVWQLAGTEQTEVIMDLSHITPYLSE